MTGLSTEEQDTRDMMRLAQGHDSALNDLMERHSRKVFHYLLRSLENEHEAGDLAQETFVRVYQNREKFDPQQRFLAWLYTIASNLVRDRYRWRSRHPQVSLDVNRSDDGAGMIKDSLVDGSPEPGEALERAERSQAVKAAVATLPAELREPLILYVYEGFSQGQIGEILNCSAKAVETRIYRARNVLREKLAKAV